METVDLTQDTGYHLVARSEGELRAAHGQMLDWTRAKLQQCGEELGIEEQNIAIAEERKWATAPFKRRAGALRKRIRFYGKIQLALEAGYVIVPNFPLTLFAIRTDANAPRQTIERVGGSWFRNFPQSAKLLPAGEGEYRNPNPGTVIHNTFEGPSAHGGGTNTITLQGPADEWNEIEFPIALARPALMELTGETMALKLFDEIGVAVDSPRARTGDPIIVGRLRNPRSSRPDVSFFIGWYFDPSNL